MKDYTIYVTEEIARKAMEKGFECKTINYSADLFYKELPPNVYDSYNNYFLPTAEQICGWLEEVFHIFPISILCYLSNGICWTPQIMSISYDGENEFNSINDELVNLDFQTRKEALLEGIKKALEII